MNHGTVARRLLGEPVGGLQANRSWHVARHDRGLARNMTPNVAGDQPRAQVVVAARRGRDQHGQRLAAIEIGDRIGGGGRRQPGRQRQKCETCAAEYHVAPTL